MLTNANKGYLVGWPNANVSKKIAYISILYNNSVKGKKNVWVKVAMTITSNVEKFSDF